MARDGDVGRANDNWALQLDNARYVEHDDAGAARVLDTLVLESRVAPYGTPSDTSARFTVWRCRDGRCELPVHSVEELLRRL